MLVLRRLAWRRCRSSSAAQNAASGVEELRSRLWRGDPSPLEIFAARGWAPDVEMVAQAMLIALRNRNYKKVLEYEILKDDGRLKLLRIQALQRLGKWEDSLALLLKKKKLPKSDRLRARLVPLLRFQYRHACYEMTGTPAVVAASRLLAFLDVDRFVKGHTVVGISRAARSMDIEKAEGLFRLVEPPTVASVAALVDAYCQVGDIEMARSVFKTLPLETHSHKACTVLVRALTRVDPAEALRLHQAAAAAGKKIIPRVSDLLCQALSFFELDAAVALGIELETAFSFKVCYDAWRRTISSSATTRLRHDLVRTPQDAIDLLVKAIDEGAAYTDRDVDLLLARIKPHWRICLELIDLVRRFPPPSFQ